MIINYTANQYNQDTLQELMPDGEYNAKITNITDFISKENEHFLRICFTIIDGLFAKANINASIAIESQDEKKLEKHKKKLDGICSALSIKHIGDTDELLGGELVIKVLSFPADDGRKNYVAGFSKKETSEPIDDEQLNNNHEDIPF